MDDPRPYLDVSHFISESERTHTILRQYQNQSFIQNYLLGLSPNAKGWGRGLSSGASPAVPPSTFIHATFQAPTPGQPRIRWLSTHAVIPFVDSICSNHIIETRFDNIWITLCFLLLVCGYCIQTYLMQKWHFAELVSIFRFVFVFADSVELLISERCTIPFEASSPPIRPDPTAQKDPIPILSVERHFISTFSRSPLCLLQIIPHQFSLIL